ncbi:MAG: mannose-6-phosphate isomerase [Verrucomicrobia bacterium]|jgi:mannose-6-phosphate isomerase|nr:mannose-6-phosphate isomerase [Verrucomicrobiota bacterium]
MKFHLFEPIYMERVWGGTRFASELGRILPRGKIIGESWDIVDRPEAQSRTSEGLSIRELLQTDPEGIMGTDWPTDRPFPILVKWLDCREKLSLQVHPPAAVATELGGEPKTENWYIAAADPGATLMAGLRKGVARKSFEAGLKANNLEPFVHRIDVHAGESIFIPSGRLHAIGGGNLILEIQQNSDTTYRVFDWGRVGLDGMPRQLHIDASLKSIDFDDFEPDTIKATEGDQTLVKSDVFNLRKICLQADESLSFELGQPRILSLVNGELEEADGSMVRLGDNVLLPAKNDFNFTAKCPTELLLTENFVKPA